MSRIGKKAIAVPGGVTVTVDGQAVTAKGTAPLLIVEAVLAVLAGALVLLGVHPALTFAVVLPFWAFVAWFFRDPERQALGDEQQLVSPADGLVSDIVQLDDPAMGVPCTRIGIFLSVFDVHVNRVPCSGTVASVHERAGGFFDARDPRAITDNAAATIVLRRPDGIAIGVRQITGLIARRIVCPATVGKAYARGERYGMIRFGSRTELLVPTEALGDVLVGVGQRVAGGASLLASLRAAPAGAPPATGAAEHAATG